MIASSLSDERRCSAGPARRYTPDSGGVGSPPSSTPRWRELDPRRAVRPRPPRLTTTVPLLQERLFTRMIQDVPEEKHQTATVRTVVAECGDGEGFCVAEIDRERVRRVRAAMPIGAHRRV